MAGAGHAMAGMVRRSQTVPGPPPMYLDQTVTPSTSQGLRPDERRYFAGEATATPQRSGSKGEDGNQDGNRRDARRSTVTGSLNGRRSMESFHKETDSLRILEDENRVLREELSRLQTTAIDSLHRRPMAAIAGGGFRGPTNNRQPTPQQCMCESLRAKLAKIRHELREARGEQDSRWCCPVTKEVRDSEAQTTPPKEEAPVTPSFYQPPKTAPTPSGAARKLALRCGSLVDATTQSEMATAEATTQAASSTCHAEAQCETEAVSEMAELGVQVGSGISVPADMETQTASSAILQDTASQVVADASDAGVQAGQSSALPAEAASQTEALAAVEAEVQCCAEATSAAMQTEPAAGVSVACEVDFTSQVPKLRNSCSAASQTIPPTRSAAAVQTVRAMRTAVATQATPTPISRAEQSTQAEDDRLVAALKREAAHEARIDDLEAELALLSVQNEALAAEKLKANEKAEAFQHMAQTKAFGQMNVTILCPRAECTVSGERIEMDSWNPERLREEFEREVLPRFTRVFVEEADKNAPKGASKARSDAVDRAMQDFAETFRERLSAMLSAPNAQAAVQAAAASKGGK